MLVDFDMEQRHATKVYVDNHVAISILNNPIFQVKQSISRSSSIF